MNRFIAVFVSLTLFAGCQSWPSHNANPKTKAVTGARADKMMRTSIDAELAREQHGERPSSGKKTWREHWDWRISLWRKNKHREYEDYLIRRRKELGLKKIRDL